MKISSLTFYSFQASW